MVVGLSVLKDFVKSLAELPLVHQNIFAVASSIAMIFIYSVFVWKVHRAISRKDIISLNLAQYNSVDHPILNKVLAGVLYLVEYIIVLPFLVLFWYVLFALALLFFSENFSLEQILLLSAAVVGSIRLLAYYDSNISAEIAKLLPLTILGITLLNPRLLEAGRFIGSISQIPELTQSIGYALLFVVGLEILLRFLDLFKRIIMDDKD